MATAKGFCPQCKVPYDEKTKRFALGFSSYVKFLNSIYQCSNCRFIHSWDNSKCDLEALTSELQ